MTIFPPRPASFCCAICGTLQDYDSPTARFSGRFYRADEYDIAPLCRRCEINWGKGEGGWGDKNRDRRIIRQIGALAAVLDVEAHRAAHKMGPLHGKR